MRNVSGLLRVIPVVEVMLPTLGSAQEEAASLARGIGAGLREMSPWSMFISADIVVKAVMVGLAFASLVTWTVFLAKSFEVFRARRRLAAGLRRIANAKTLRDARELCADENGILARFLDAAAHEETSASDRAANSSIMDRAASRLSEIIRAEQRGMRRGMGALATIGSTAPFVGLLGTVWGIMGFSFVGISSHAHTTNLAVVAPGIAEALLATADGAGGRDPRRGDLQRHFSVALTAYKALISPTSTGPAEPPRGILSRDLDCGPRAFARSAE